MKKVKRNILLNPGPATTTDTVKYAQVVPDICPREKEFGAVMESVSKDLLKIVGGNPEEYIAVLFGGSGTAGMDAAINSVTPPDKKILIINNGAYGERMVKIAKSYSIDHVELKFEWDALPDLSKIENAIKKDRGISCVSMIHHETTTGLLNAVKETGVLVKKYNKTFIVDTISSFAGIPIDIKEFNIDFLMSTSNKCIQGMAGVCFVICKKEELKKIKDYPRRSYYLSLYDQYDYFKEHYKMRFTPPVQSDYALRKGVTDLGFKILTDPEEESHILITLMDPKDPEFDFDKLHDKLFAEGFTIYPGKVGKVNTFRLANMGAIDQKDIKEFLKVLKKIINDMDIKI